MIFITLAFLHHKKSEGISFIKKQPIWFVIVIQILDIIRGWFMEPSVQNIFNKTTAVMLIFIGVRIALEENAV